MTSLLRLQCILSLSVESLWIRFVTFLIPILSYQLRNALIFPKNDVSKRRDRIEETLEKERKGFGMKAIGGKQKIDKIDKCKKMD